MLKIFSQPVEHIFKLQKTVLDALHRLGIFELRHLLLYKPSYFIKRKLFPDLSHVIDDEQVILEVEIKEIMIGRGRNKRSPTKIYCENNLSQGITLAYFNRIPPFIFSSLKIGSKKIISGKIEKHQDYIQITHPDYYFRKEDISEFEPIYPLTYALTNKHLRSLIKEALRKMPIVDEWLPIELREKSGGISFNQAVYLLHNPSNNNELYQRALKRFEIDELFANQLSLALIRKYREFSPGRVFKKNLSLQQEILKYLNFELTDSQEQVIEEIEACQAQDKRMMRVLQGDVGAGKTLVALMTILNVVSTGAQAALMVPTDILANQHFIFFQNALEKTNIKVSLLTGKIKPKERKELLENLINGEIKILIGTHALFQEKVDFNDLGYIVIDEQHRFGVQQRVDLMEKGPKADILIITATPIPRSLNLILFGDMEVSKLTSKPKGRLPIITTCISEDKVAGLMISLDKILNQGDKIYWVCPLIEQLEEENSDITVTDTITRFSLLNKYYPDKVSLIHGKMNGLEKEAAMQEFKNNKCILVATTVIEVGVDVSDATLIIIENAEKFGLAQLHQLRGRVGRGNKQSYCILIYGSRITNIAKERLKIMKISNDGFYIAEQDLILRGGGDMLGHKQSGEQSFIFIDPLKDLELLNLTFSVTKKLIENKDINKQTILLELLNIFGYNDHYTNFIKLN